MRRHSSIRQTFATGLRERTEAFPTALDRVIAVHWHPEGSHRGFALYLRVPFTRLSVLLQWHDISLRRGVERTEEGFNVYLGHLEANLCREQGEMYRGTL